MATKIYDESINKYFDWGGDLEHTNGLPVSGKRVQEFIKNSLNKKFGFLYYDKDPIKNDKGEDIIGTGSNQYMLFADEEDYNKWRSEGLITYVLDSFKAPAPASIKIGKQFIGSGEDNERVELNILETNLSADSSVIGFEYSVRDDGGNEVMSGLTVTINITNNNGVFNQVQSVPSAKAEKDQFITFSTADYPNIDIFNSLTEGINNIRITVLSNEYNVSTIISYRINVLNLRISSTFNDPTENTTVHRAFRPVDANADLKIDITGIGVGTKTLKGVIDGTKEIQFDAEDPTSTSFFLGNTEVSQKTVVIPKINFEGLDKTQIHNIQFYFSISADLNSNTLYYDFIFQNNNISRGYTLLFKELSFSGNEHFITDENDDQLLYTFKCSQYEIIEFEYSLANSRSTESINLNIILQKNQNGTYVTLPEESETFTSKSGEKYTYSHKFNNDGQYRLIFDTGSSEVARTFEINVTPMEMGNVVKATEGLVLELDATNKSNTAQLATDDPSVWVPNYIDSFINNLWNENNQKIICDKVVWKNNQNGFENNTLILNNDATVNIPITLSDIKTESGLTFEIDFETKNVQNDNAVIMNYSADEIPEDLTEFNLASSGILVKGCEAQFNASGLLKTNYKENTRQKIQFILNRTVNKTQVEENLSSRDYNLMYIVVNGILDRVCELDPGFSWNSPSSIVIGNIGGLAETIIHSIRIYNRALKIEECLNNFIVDSDNVKEKFDDNNLYQKENTELLDISKIYNAGIPVMRIYGNPTTSIVQLFDKKANVPVDILYTDLKNPDYDFFALNAWLSNQGTSSMNYPRRNLRLYLNKGTDDKTVRGYAPTYCYDYKTLVFPGLTNMDVIRELQEASLVSHDAVLAKIEELKVTYKDNNSVLYSLENVRTNKKTMKSSYYPISYDLAVEYRHAGVKLFTYKEIKDEEGNVVATEYKKVKASAALKDNTQYYTQGGYWKFKDKSLYTDRWTLKCDYAESSMSHNAGIGRLWGDVMKNVDVGDKGSTFDENGNPISDSKPCMTNAQREVEKYAASKSGNKQNAEQLGFDVRTSCDGYPIVIFNYPRSENDGEFTGYVQDPIFLGLYNIMTDKGSTPLFGFEDISDESGKTLYDCGTTLDTVKIIDDNGKEVEIVTGVNQRTECWECLQNGSQLAQMRTTTTDLKDKDGDGNIATTNENRLIWKSFEARWPDNDDLNNTRTNNLESFIRFINFCQDAVTIRVGEEGNDRNGYELSDFRELDNDESNKDKHDQRQATLLYNKKHSGMSSKDYITDPELIEEGLNNWNGILYLSVPATSYKDKSSTFYAKYKEGDEIPPGSNIGDIKYDNRGVVIFLTAEEILEDQSLCNTIMKPGNMYYYQDYDSGNVTGQSFKELYSNDATLAVRAAAIDKQLHSNKPQIFVASEDESEREFVELDREPQAGETWAIFDSTYDRSIIRKTVNTTPIGSKVYIGRVPTFDGKRKYNANDPQVKYNGYPLSDDPTNVYNGKSVGDLIYGEESYVDVYLTENNKKYYYIDEFGEQQQYIDTVIIQDYENSTKLQYFSEQKYNHLDVWKIAAYYVYLMRFAATDQVIKNTMLTTEDGKHYYFINYDNDTTLGVRNDGLLKYSWDIDRTTYDYSIGSYAYAGFGSVLWNLLEQDEDFMDKVQTIANAMVTSNVLTYKIALDMFNVKQAGTWSETLYNESELYKYIGIFNNLDNNYSKDGRWNNKYLSFLQGSRQSHREWWLRHRFDLYDSMWGAGEYAQNNILIYITQDGSPSRPAPFLNITAASKFYFMVQSNGRQLPGDTFVELNAGESYVFKATQGTMGSSDPVSLLGGYKCKTIDFSNYRDSLGRTVAIGWTDPDLSMIQELIFGGDFTLEQKPACSVGSISGLEYLKSLRKLDIRTCSQLTQTDLPFSSLTNLKELLAEGSVIRTFHPNSGSEFNRVSLPTTLNSLKLEKNTFRNDDPNIDPFVFKPTKSLKTISILYSDKDVKSDTSYGIDILDLLNKWITDLVINISDQSVYETYSCKLALSNRLYLPIYITNPNYNDEMYEQDPEIFDLQAAEENISLFPLKANEDIYDRAFSLWKAALQQNPNDNIQIHSLIWFIGIRRMFGTNINLEHRFDITEGIVVIKGTGLNKDTNEYDTITQQDFDILNSNIFGENWLSMNNIYHFDYEGTQQTFKAIKNLDTNELIQPSVDVTGTYYEVNCGNNLGIVFTTFPMQNVEVSFKPYLIDGTNTYDYFDLISEGVYQYDSRNIHADVLYETKKTTLSFNNAGAELHIGQSLITSKTDLKYQIDVALNEGTSSASSVSFRINKVLLPTSSEEFMFIDNGIDVTSSGIEINEEQTVKNLTLYWKPTIDDLTSVNAKLNAPITFEPIRVISENYLVTAEDITNNDVLQIKNQQNDLVIGENGLVKICDIEYKPFIYRESIRFNYQFTLSFDAVINGILNTSLLVKINNNPIEVCYLSADQAQINRKYVKIDNFNKDGNIIDINDENFNPNDLEKIDLTTLTDDNEVYKALGLENINNLINNGITNISFSKITQYFVSEDPITVNYKLNFDKFNINNSENDWGLQYNLNRNYFGSQFGQVNINTQSLNGTNPSFNITLAQGYSYIYNGFMLLSINDKFYSQESSDKADHIIYLIISFDFGRLLLDKFKITKIENNNILTAEEDNNIILTGLNGRTDGDYTKNYSSPINVYTLHDPSAENDTVNQKTLSFNIQSASIVNNEEVIWDNFKLSGKDPLLYINPKYYDNLSLNCKDDQNRDIPGTNNYYYIFNNGTFNTVNNTETSITLNCETDIPIDTNSDFPVILIVNNGDLTTLKYKFTVHATRSIAVNGNWQELSTGDNGKFYYYDDDKNFYNQTVFNTTQNPLDKNIIRGIIYVYEDGADKKYISLDIDCFTENNKKYLFSPKSKYAEMIYKAGLSKSYDGSANKTIKKFEDGFGAVNNNDIPYLLPIYKLGFSAHISDDLDKYINSESPANEKHAIEIIWYLMFKLYGDQFNNDYLTASQNGETFNIITKDNSNTYSNPFRAEVYDKYLQHKEDGTLINVFYKWYGFINALLNNNSSRVEYDDVSFNLQQFDNNYAANAVDNNDIKLGYIINAINYIYDSSNRTLTDNTVYNSSNDSIMNLFNKYKANNHNNDLKILNTEETLNIISVFNTKASELTNILNFIDGTKYSLNNIITSTIEDDIYQSYFEDYLGMPYNNSAGTWGGNYFGTNVNSSKLVNQNREIDYSHIQLFWTSDMFNTDYKYRSTTNDYNNTFVYENNNYFVSWPSLLTDDTNERIIKLITTDSLWQDTSVGSLCKISINNGYKLNVLYGIKF